MFRLFLLLLIISIVDAAKGSFSLELKRTKKHQSLAKYSKLGGASVYSENEEDYFADISFGPNANQLQTFRVLLDTGSYATWVPHRGCRTYAMFPEHCQGRDGTPAPATSRTYNSAGRNPEPGFKATYDFTFNTQSGYKDALARGQFVEDTIWFGTPPNSVRVEEIRFGVADNIQMPDDFGILGLSARDDEDDTRTGTHFLSRLDDVLTHKMFTLFYQPGGGRITFGEYDPHNCGMVRSIVPVAPETINWQFRMDSFILNNERLFGATDVISDSGSTDIHVPKNAFDTIMAAIGDVEYDPSQNSLPHVSCNRVQNIRIKLMIGDMPYSLPVNALTERAHNNMCSIHIVPHSNDYPGKPWLLGAPWLRSYCQIHYFNNMQHPEIGFALINRHVGDGQYFH